MLKGPLHNVPPCVSYVVMLRELGVKVHVITEVCANETVQLIEKSGATIEIIGNQKKGNSLLNKIFYWVRYRRTMIKAIKLNYNEDDCIWLGDAGSSIALSGFINSKKYVMTSLELYDDNAFYKSRLSKVVLDAQLVVVCELNRARVMKRWYGLKEMPTIMPNKPFYDMKQEKCDSVVKFINELQDKPFILYQGVVHKERTLDNIAMALRMTNSDMPLVVIGKSAANDERAVIEHLQNIYSNTIYGGYFPAPQHLYITKKAHIGIAFYDDSSLNTIFCAPNKIFEYSKFNVPILGNNIPGLQLTVEKHGAGLCPDMNSPEEIAEAIKNILNNYEKFQKGAESLYNSVDNLKTMKNIVERLQLN